MKVSPIITITQLYCVCVCVCVRVCVCARAHVKVKCLVCPTTLRILDINYMASTVTKQTPRLCAATWLYQHNKCTHNIMSTIFL